MPWLLRIRRYLANLTMGRLVLWHYFILYLVVVARYFDPRPSIWLTAAGISAIIGWALWINTTRSGTRVVRLEAWPVARLFLFPFCVSSFSSLVKERHFLLIFSPRPMEMAFVAALCAVFGLSAYFAKRFDRGISSPEPRDPMEPIAEAAIETKALGDEAQQG